LEPSGIRPNGIHVVALVATYPVAFSVCWKACYINAFLISANHTNINHSAPLSVVKNTCPFIRGLTAATASSLLAPRLLSSSPKDFIEARKVNEGRERRKPKPKSNFLIKES